MLSTISLKGKKNERCELIQALISEIVHITHKEMSSRNHLGLYSGLAGHILFLFQAKIFDDEYVSDAFLEERINFLINMAEKSRFNFSLSNGLSGIAWLLEFIFKKINNTSEINNSTDDILYRELSKEIWHGEIEVILGLAGVTTYLYRRIGSEKAEQCIIEIVRHFSSLSSTTDSGNLYWPTKFESALRKDKMDEEKIEVDLGLSHGHVGVIASLLPALKYKSTHVQAKGMIESGCNWLVEQSQCVDSYGSYYAYLQGDNKESKLGWCYGDLSIAITLLRAGKAINNASYVDFALEIAKHCAAREQIPIHKNNHAICHGNIGLFLMFQTLYKLTNEDIFRETSNKWLNKTLDRYQDNGIQGIALISKKGKYNMGLLTGLPGIGLCLLSALGQDIDWTDSLLLSSSI